MKNLQCVNMINNLQKFLASFYERYLYTISEKRYFSMLEEIKLKKNAKIIDVVCGTGRTLQSFREHDYYNSIGIDVLKFQIEICMKKGFKINKDIFLMNFLKNKFKNESFDLVFSEGLLEHYKNMKPFVKEMCRISKKYVLQLQPNYNLSGKPFLLVRNLYLKIFNTLPKFYEKQYNIKDYEKIFAKNNFKLINTKDLVLKSHYALLFERK